MKSTVQFMKTFCLLGFVAFSSLLEGAHAYQSEKASPPFEENRNVVKPYQVDGAASNFSQNSDLSQDRALPLRWVDLDSPAVKELERLGVRVAQDHLINVDGVRYERLQWRSELHRQLSLELQDPDKADRIETEFFNHILPKIAEQPRAVERFESWLLAHAIFLGSTIHHAIDLYKAHDIAGQVELDDEVLDGFFTSLHEEWDASEWPEDPHAAQSRRVMFLTTSGGGGHYTVSTAMAKELKNSEDYHVRALDYAKLQYRCDPMWITTKRYTSDKIYSEIFQQQDDVEKANLYWDIYGVLEEYVPNACNRAVKDEVKQEKPHILISTMPHWTLHTDVAYSLDLPLRYTATDYQIASGIFQSIYHTIQNIVSGVTRFVEFWLPADDVEMFRDLAHQEVDHQDALELREVVRRAVYGGASHFEIYSHPKNPFYVLGYPVRHKFVPQEMSSEEMEDLRQSLEVPEESRVLILSMGRQGVGVLGEIVQRLRQEAEQLSQKLHVVVVCGKNAKIAQEIRDYLSAQDDQDAVSFDVQGYLDEESMAKYFTVAEGLISKPGGATTAEASAMKLPLLICHSHTWEQANREYLERKGLAFDFNLTAALVPQVNVFLKMKMKENAKVDIVPWASRMREALEDFFLGEPLEKS